MTKQLNFLIDVSFLVNVRIVRHNKNWLVFLPFYCH